MSAELHPLQNHLILSHVASFLKFKDLKLFRSVCKSWNNSSIARFQCKSCVIFKDDHGRTRIRKFLKDDLDTFVCFKFIRLDVRKKYKQIMEFFLEQQGPLVKEVAFVNCKIDYGQVVNRLHNLMVLSIAMPTASEDDEEEEDDMSLTELVENKNLKCLEITGRTSDDYDESLDWNYFINPFPKIEVLGAHCRSSHDLTRLLSMMTATSASALPNLLDFSCILTDLHNSHLELLSKVDCKLRSLDISLAPDIDETVMHSLIKRHSSTLTNFKFFRDCDQPLALFHAGNWSCASKVLTSMDIQCNMVDSLNFIQYFPSLKTLIMTQFGDSEVSFYNTVVRKTDPKLIFPSVRSFSFEYYLAPDCIDRIVVALPNMTRLSVYLIDESIRVVFREAGNLQELVVLGTQLSDEGITGVSKHLLDRNYKFMKDFRKLPYIADLKNLWRFSLYPQPQKKITDHSVDYGFMESKALTSIDVPETMISNEGIEKLQSKPGLLSLVSPFICEDGMVFSRPSSLQSWP